MRSEAATAAAEHSHSRLQLFGFVALVLAGGLGLHAVAGGPRLPDGAPDVTQIGALLNGTSLPPGGVAFVLVSVAWLVWLWVFGSLIVEVLLIGLESVARGAAWVISLRRIADRVTLPLARRVVAAAFAVQILTRPVVVSAAPAPDTVQVVTASIDERAGAIEAEGVPGTTYLVRPGDTLWAIAEQAYGSGAEYRRLVSANVGRRMPDGAAFTAQGIIRPGWILDVPEPSISPDQASGVRWYTVQPGDSLSSIATRVLGDRERWTDLYDLNHDTAHLADGRVLDDPDLIWPGLRLRLPDPRVPEPDAPEPATTPTDSIVIAAAASPSYTQEDALPSPPPVRASEVSSDDAPPEPLPPLVRDIHPVVLTPEDQPAVEPASATDEPHAVAKLDPPTLRVPQIDPALGALGVAAAAGLATLGLTRLRRLRPLPHEPESDVVVEGGYAEAHLAPELARHLSGDRIEPSLALLAQFLRVLEDYHLTDVQPIFLRRGRSSSTVTLAAGLAEQAILLDLAPVFAERLHVDCAAAVSTDEDVQMCLTPLSKTSALPPAGATRDLLPWFVSLGVLYDHQLFAVNWAALGHVLVVSLPGHGAQTILTSLLAGLTARCSPDELRVWLVGRSRSLPPAITELPHLEVTVEPDGDDALAGLVARLRVELEQRALGGAWPELVIAVPELSSLAGCSDELQLLLAGAAANGVRLVAGSTDAAMAAADPLLATFTTRMVLHLEEEEHSVALLGVADAAFLGGGGRLLVRVDGREPVEMYGYQVPPEHLERLVRVMRSAYQSSPRARFDLAPPILSEVVPVAGDGIALDEALDDPPKPESVDIEADSENDDQLPPANGVAERPDQQIESAEPRVPIVLVTPEAPIHVLCFGEPRVLCAGTQVWPKAKGGDAKPWEFLLYLACQSIEGVTREVAVQALWPDDEVLDATHRFRQLRYRIRGALSKAENPPSGDGISLERLGTLYLNHSIVYSDAQEFLELTRLARIFSGRQSIPYLERARSLFTADLLFGPGVRRYAWADERDESGVTLREHFRRRFQHATLTLAELYADAGDVSAALATYHELIELEPGDERVWRAMFRLHAVQNDLQSLIQDERQLRAVLRELAMREGEEPLADACEPSEETRRDFDRLLAQLNAAEGASSMR